MSLRIQACPDAGTRRRARLMPAGVAAGTVVLALVVGPAAAGAAPVTTVACSASALATAVSGASSGAVLSLTPMCTYTLTGGLTAAVSLTIEGNGDTIAGCTG